MAPYLLVAHQTVTSPELLKVVRGVRDQDLERDKGIPENAMKLARLIAAHDAVLICTPEYNGSIPPLVKNTIGVSGNSGTRKLRVRSGRTAARSAR